MLCDKFSHMVQGVVWVVSVVQCHPGPPLARLHTTHT